jgi:hypothetical protein
MYQEKNGSLHKVADKVVRIEASLLYKASQTVTLYFTEAQLQGLEAATGVARTAFSVYQVSAASYTAAASNNTKKYAATYTAIPGSGGYYTFTFSEKVNGSFTVGYQVSVLGTAANRSIGAAEEQTAATWQFGSIYPNPGHGIATMTVTVPKAQRVGIDVINVAGQVIYTRTQQVTEGLNKMALPVDRLNTGSYMIRFRDAEGRTLNTQQYTRN